MSTLDEQATPVLWQRHDLPGAEACRLRQIDGGYMVEGAAVLAFEREACRLDYAIRCDPGWVTQEAVVSGWVGTSGVDIRVMRDASGFWELNGTSCGRVSGCVDVDLNFSPSTNSLPIHRLRLAVGQSARVTAAWLRFPSFALEPLEQRYTRLGERRYRYESNGGRFVAEVTVDDQGLVLDYGDLWSREVPMR